VRCSAPDQAAVAQDRRALEDVPQLADVTGPAVLDEALACLARDAGGRPGDALGEIGEEEVAEREDVLGALAQRRKADLEHLEPVVEILAEGAALDGGTQVPVGGGDEAHVGGQPLGATHTLELPLLEHAQELGLRGQAHLRHLVEEQRASCGELHLAGLGLGRAGERAALVPNSSDSSRFSGRAAQFSATNGPSARRDARWMVRAITSLPVPDSPSNSTVESVGATWAAILSTRFHDGDSPPTRP
jgi:hypothetical protein